MSFSITIIRVLVKCSLGRGHIVQHLPVHVSRVVHSCARAHHMVAHLVLRGLGVQGLGCLGRVWGLGRFRVLGFRGLGVQGLGCLGRVQGCRVLGLRGLGFQGLGVQDVQGLWFRDSRFRAQDGGRADARLSPIPDHPERVLSRVVQGLMRRGMHLAGTRIFLSSFTGAAVLSTSQLQALRPLLPTCSVMSTGTIYQKVVSLERKLKFIIRRTIMPDLESPLQFFFWLTSYSYMARIL